MTDHLKGARDARSSASVLRAGLRRSGLTRSQLWANYLSVGGSMTEAELDAALRGALRLRPHEHDVIAQAVNDDFVEQGQNHPVPYFEDL